MKRFPTILIALLVLSAHAVAQPLVNSQWEGARVAFLGDSITDARQLEQTNNVYWNNLADILGIEPYVYGISGHKMSQIVGQGEKLEAEHGQAVDAIIVFIGTNDYNSGTPMGEWYSYSTKTTVEDGPVEVERRHRELIFDNSTFKGRANIALRWLKTHYPDKQIIFLTPIHRGAARFSDRNIQPPESYANACGLFIDDYVQAVRELASVWAVPVIDLNSISGLYPMVDEHAGYFRDSRTDRLHPNTRGQLRMAYAIAYQLLAYPARFDKYLALGFNGVSDAATTSGILDVLEENGAPASFFGVGDNTGGKLARLVRRAAALGCDVSEGPLDHAHVSGLDPESLLSSVRDGDIVLLDYSDGGDAVVEALKVLLPELRKRGFVLVTVPELVEGIYTNVYL